jgi:hypothetical protein
MAALSSLRIVTSYNNEPYVRSLTATIQWNPNNANTWVTFSSANQAVVNYFNIYWNLQTTGGTTAPITTAYNPTHNKTITFGSAGSDIPDNINPIIVNFTTPYYNPAFFSYTVNTLSISAAVGIWPNGWPTYPLDDNGNAIITTPSLSFDNFPQISGDLFVNYESTSKNNTFYRLTSSTPFNANINVVSKNFPISTAFNDSYYQTILVLNDTQTLNALNQVTTFNCTTPVICSLKATISAVSAVGSLTNFFTPHTIYLNSISGIFVNVLPTANFIAYPSLYFTNAITPPTPLNASNYTLSPGVCFYGEGHTEGINLSAASNNNITNYIWRDKNYVQFFNLANPLNTNTNVLSVQTSIGSYPTIPIGLQITTAAIPSTAPIIKYDDVTGTPSYYPYFSSTVDISGNELSTNNQYHQSIKVVPYDAVSYAFNAGFTDPAIFLPADNSATKFTASLNVGYNGVASIQPCYDKYGIDWKWSTFENCLSTQSIFALPSSWTTTGSAGAFPKKWYKECNSTYSNDGCFAGSVTPSPVGCVGSNTYWSLSTPSWQIPPQNNFGSTFIYAFNFDQPYYSRTYTFSPTKITPGVITVTENVSCTINASPGDWKTKITTVTAASAFTIQGAPILRLYTPNRYVLTGTNVVFQNITLNSGFLNSLSIDYGDKIVSSLTAPNVSQNFTHAYNTIGPKTIQLTGTSIYGGYVVKTFPNIITVVNNYDDVIPGSYITTNTPLTPPYTSVPLIAPNDNAVADNINSVITKFYENLNYLQLRSKVYPNTTLESFGWLGVPQPTAAPATNTTAATGSTWKDYINTDVTWTSLYCGLTPPPTPTAPPDTGVSTGPSTGPNLLTYVINITANKNNVNTVTELIKLGWNQTTNVNVRINVYSGVTVYSNSISSPALTINALPVGSQITLNNAGTIIGAGGAGGGAGQTGSPGGPALQLNYPTTIFNNGNISGGGGGGGGGNGGTLAGLSVINSSAYTCGFTSCPGYYTSGSALPGSRDNPNPPIPATTYCAGGYYSNCYGGCRCYDQYHYNCGTLNCPTTTDVSGGAGGNGESLNAATNGISGAGGSAGNGGAGGSGGNSGNSSSDGNKGGAPGTSIVNTNYIISNKNIGVELP